MSPGFLGWVPPAAAIYALGLVILGIDLRVPLDVDTAICYSVGIIGCGWLRSRRHLWIATTLFIIFTFSDLVIGAPAVFPETPRWVFVANRMFLAGALLLLTAIVHLWIRGVEAIEQYGALLARQNDALRADGSKLEERVRERTRELEIASHQRQEALAALYQAQKMEAVGQLTGGVAHDFNNLLTVIGGHAAVLRESAPSDAKAHRLDAILQAAERGARLTRQLLAFSRREMLHPERLDLRERLHETIDMMASSLRENVRIAVTLAEDLWPVEIDAAQLELALLNIGINARDAMPEGGLLSVNARNVVFAPGEDRRNGLVGEFVALTLSDTGSGIEPETLVRVFEPFFTTKDVDKGSGLGLSQVYGFAKQSGGAVAIRSEVGQGTAVTLYLPRAASPAERPPAAPPVTLPRGKGRVLYVEDNPAVASVTQEMLVDIGFEVHAVETVGAALAVVAGGRPFDLLLTDILMPGGMSGVELARELRQRMPGLPVLLTSGYSEKLSDAQDSGFTILTKPYTVRALADALARCVAPKQRD